MTWPIIPRQVFLAAEPVDIRMGMDRLSALVQNNLGKTPCDGSLYAFRNKRGTRLKIIVWDGTGVWCAMRRLHQGRFTWPTCDAPMCELGHDDWNWLTMGLEWQRLHITPSAKWRV
jgi:transposase